MKTLDKNYLSLQFKIKVLLKDGTEFQSFFEEIMEKAYSDFQKIRPYGNKGDGGNDGYRKELGIYYQVYAPNTPKVNEAKAAKKLREDFLKLQNEWNEISNIKEYYFVYNDKYDGSVQLVEQAKTDLEKNNPGIKFKSLLAKDLEEIFFQLEEPDILGLGFHIDQRQAISNASTYLENVKDELDRENATIAYKILENVKNIVFELSDENLTLEYEILEGRCLQKFERVDEAKKKYESISKKFPKDPRPFLYLAEICLRDNDFDKNINLLEKAEEINSGFWLLELERILRKQNLGDGVDINTIDEKAFPDNPKIKADFYRLYGLLLENSGDQTNADRFLEIAIHLNPDKFSTYLDDLALIEKRMFESENASRRLQLSQLLLEKVEDVTIKFAGYGDIGARNNLRLNSKKFYANIIQENIGELESLAKEIFTLSLNCYFDRQVEHIIASVFKVISRVGPTVVGYGLVTKKRNQPKRMITLFGNGR